MFWGCPPFSFIILIWRLFNWPVRGEPQLWLQEVMRYWRSCILHWDWIPGPLSSVYNHKGNVNNLDSVNFQHTSFHLMFVSCTEISMKSDPSSKDTPLLFSDAIFSRDLISSVNTTVLLQLVFKVKVNFIVNKVQLVQVTTQRNAPSCRQSTGFHVRVTSPLDVIFWQ